MARCSPAVLAKALSHGAPLTFQQLRAALGGASRSTTFRYLRLVRFVRSYSPNGRYYTHHDPVRFDRYGLVSLGDIHFSRDNSLAATVLRLVREADAGLTHKELQRLLHVPVHHPLLAAVRRRDLLRERPGPVWVYLSRDPLIGAVQRQTRSRRRPATPCRKRSCSATCSATAGPCSGIPSCWTPPAKCCGLSIAPIT